MLFCPSSSNFCFSDFNLYHYSILSFALFCLAKVCEHFVLLNVKKETLLIVSYFVNVVSTNLISWQSRSLKQWLLSCRFLRRLVVNDHLNILNCLCNVFVVDLACYFETWQIVLEKVVKELKLLKVIVTSRYWRSWWPFNKAFRWSQTLLRWSVTIDLPLF